MRSGQASVEMVIILAISMTVILLVLVIYDQTSTSLLSQSSVSEAKAAVNNLADAIEAVHVQAVGARTTLFIQIPGNVKNFTLQNKILSAVLSGPGADRNIYRTFGFNVTGNLSVSPGTHLVNIESKIGYVEASTSS